jgi:hypothetical protein
MEKQRDKAAKKAQRKIERLNSPGETAAELEEPAATADESETPPE